MFPSAEMKMFGGNYAMIFSESGNIAIKKIRTENGLLFDVPQFGVYQINKENRLLFGKAQVSLFDMKHMNSLNGQAVAALREYLKYRLSRDSNAKRSFTLQELSYIVEDIRPAVSEESILKLMIDVGVIQNDSKLFNYLQDLHSDTPPLPQVGAQKSGLDPFTVGFLHMLHSKTTQGIARTETELRTQLPRQAIEWLNNFYKTDDMAHINVYQRILESSRYHMKKSTNVQPWWMWQKSAFAQNIGLFIIDNRILDDDPSIKVKTIIQDDKVISGVISKKYGGFYIRDPKTTYYYGKTRVYVMSVSTKQEESNDSMRETQTVATATEMRELEPMAHP